MRFKRSRPTEAGNKKALRKRRAFEKEQRIKLLLGGDALELVREFFDATGRVDQALLAGVGGMRIHRHVADDDEILGTIDVFLTGGFHRGLRQEAFARSDIEEADVVERGMAFGFHSGKKGLISLGALCNAARLC